MKSFNLIVVIGNLTRDPEIKRMANGTALCECSLAINESFNDSSGIKQECTSFIDFKIWAKGGELFCTHMKKGSCVLLKGKIRQERWETKDGEKRNRIVMIADEFTFLDGKTKEPNSKTDDVKDSSADNNDMDSGFDIF